LARIQSRLNCLRPQRHIGFHPSPDSRMPSSSERVLGHGFGGNCKLNGRGQSIALPPVDGKASGGTWGLCPLR
jgi:hypothetical protein